ncbi:MAG: diacylglycerol kinase family lipid kinase [Actinobacteria bacterium]|nr:diacylglycerol kinase family lipid kinase [Actinomycetota bacterium]
MKVGLVFNPVAGENAFGKAAAHLIGVIEREFERQGVAVSLYRISRAKEGISLAQRAVNEGCSVVAAAGGDGTVNEVLNGIVGKGVLLGVIPIGTTNVFARQISMPLDLNKKSDLEKTVEIIKKCNTIQIDLGLAGERYFLLMAGVGFDAMVVKEVKPLIKKVFRGLAYPLTALRLVLKCESSLFQIVLDESHLSKNAYFVLIGNSKYYSGRFSIASYADIQDGFLDVCIFKKKNFFDIFRHSAGILTGRHLNFADVDYYQAKEINVFSERKLLVQVDGEVLGSTPMKFKVVPLCQSVVVP